MAQADAEPPPLLLHGARTEPSALLKLQGSVHCAWDKEVPVQPMVDSGASGMGFADPGLVRRCGAQIRPSSRRIILADGSEVRAAGEVTLSYSLQAYTCTTKEQTPPARITSTFIVTPLAPYELILGIGWLEQHHAQVGFRERNIQIKVDGQGKPHCIRPLARCNDSGAEIGTAEPPARLQSISVRSLRKQARRGGIERLYMAVVRDTGAVEVQSVPQPKGAENPRVAALLAEFADVSPETMPAGVPPNRGVEHAIVLKPGARPPPPRSLHHQSPKDLDAIRAHLDAGLKAGTIQQSVSPFGAMMFVVPKKDGSPRIVVDYRALNEITVKNAYPLPLIDELFDRVAGAKYFTSIDLRDGFYQIALPPGDREKTAFRTRFGSYEYTVLPMGLCNAPGTFMQLMNDSFRDMLDKWVLCFLDDILIFSRTEEEHLRHLRAVLQRLRERKLYIKLKKCEFMQQEVSFLGHRIGADGLRVAPDKVGAVQQWPQPKNVSDVRSFLGLANFYRRFVKDYSRIALPLTQLTREVTGGGFTWGTEQQAAFDALKVALCAPPVLLVPDHSKPFVLNCDACKYAIGATLQQDHGNGLQPVAFFSAKMSDAERNYNVREQEFMALFRACQHWRHYLHGTQPFTLLSDHDSLKYHKTMPNLSGRLARWIEKMAEFDYTLQHIPGKDNVVADALSRRADLAAVQVRPAAPLRSILKRSITFGPSETKLFTPNPWEALVAAQAREPQTAEQQAAAVRTLPSSQRGEETPTRCGDEDRRSHTAALQQRKKPARHETAQQQAPAHAARTAAAAPHTRDRHFERVLAMVLANTESRELRQTPGRRSARAAKAAAQAQPERGSARAGRSAATAPAAEAAAAAGQDALPDNDRDGAALQERAQAGQQRTAPEALMSAVRRAAAADEEYQRWLQSPPTDTHANRGLLFVKGGQLRVPADAALRTRIMAELHDSPTGAHCGRDRMLAEAQSRFEWRGMASDVEQYVLTCDACQRNKHSKQLTPGLLMPLPLPEEPCLHWTTDAVSGLRKTKRGFDAIQVYVDRLTKLKRFAAARTSDGSVQLADTTLRTIIGPHGMPKSMVSDRDSRITARFWRELSRVLGSEIDLSTAQHPQSDGQSEREIQTLITALRSYANAQGDDWDTYLPALELAFNSKVQASTGAAPFSLVYGTQARLPIDCALDDARPPTLPAVGQRAERMHKALNHARSKAEIAQAKQKRLADQHRRLLLLKPGDKVLLATEGLQLRSGTHKLTGRYIGPFAVKGCVNDNAVALELPPLLGALHPTVNISRLKLHRDGSRRFPTRPQQLYQPPAVSTDTNGAVSYEVECVLAQRGGRGRKELLVRWKGYGAEHDQWQSRSELARSASEAIAEFDARQRDGAYHATQIALSLIATQPMAG